MSRKRKIDIPPEAVDAPPAQPAVFTVPELAERWRASRHTIMVANRAGRLQAFKVGDRHYRIREEEVIRYEQQNMARAAS